MYDKKQLSELKKIVASAGYFASVAQNVSTVFYIVGKDDKLQNFSELQKYFATTLMYLKAYFDDKKISLEQISNTVNSINQTIDNYDLDDYGNKSLIALIINIEELLFKMDKDVNISKIQEKLYEKRSAIATTMDITLKLGNDGPLYEEINSDFQKEINKSNYLNLISEYSYISSETIDVNYKTAIEKMVLTTCPSVEGYAVKEQLGLVFGEIIMKMGLLKSIGAGFENLGAVFTPGDKELGGSTSLMNDARNYAIEKMKKEAVDRGANAIIGIDSESAFGGDLMKITIMGTAVKIEKISEDNL